MPRGRRRFLDLVVAVATAGLVVGGAGVGRAVIATADNQPLASAINPDLVQPCGAEVILVVDQAVPGGAGPLAEKVAGALSGSGSRLAVVGYAASATVATPPAVGFGPLVPVDAPALAAGGAWHAAVDQGTATTPGSGRNWESGLLAAESLLAAAGSEPVLVLHVTGGLPDGADATTTTQAGPALDPARVVADRLRARPATHLLTVTAGDATLAEALKTFAGPNVAVDGSQLIEGSADDAVTVPVRSLDTVAAEIAGDLCATNIRLHATDAAGAVRAKTPLTIAVGDGATVASPTVEATDESGNLRWRVRSPLSGPLSVTIGDLAASGNDRVLLCSQGDRTLPVTATRAVLRLDEIVTGTGVVCELRSVATSAALTLSYGIVAGDVACPEAGSPAALVAVIDEPVSHCLRVTNPNAAPVSKLTVTAAALGLSGDATWTLNEPLAPGATAERRVVVPAGRAVAVEATATGRVDDADVIATAAGSVTPAPAALTVERSPATDGATPCAASDTWCLTVTNTGGTYLESISVRDASVSAETLAVPGRLAPGQSASVGGARQTNAAALTEPVATAVPVDALGESVGDAVSSAPLPDGGIAATQQLSATEVAPGQPVSATITVTNTAAKPAQAVGVRHTLCGEMGDPTSRLADNGNTTLDSGEAWVYTCSTPVVLDTVAMAVVVAQDEGPVNTRPDEILTRKPDLKVKKRQRNDLRIGSETLYVIEVINNGAVEAPNVVMTDQLPAGVTFVRANLAACTASGGTVRCSLGTLPPQDPGQEIIIELTVQAAPTALGQLLRNTASASTSGSEFNLTDNTADARGEVFAAGVCAAGSRECTPSDTTPSSLDGVTVTPGPTPELDSVTRGTTGTVAREATGGSGSGSGGSGGGSGTGFASTGANSATTASWAVVMLASGVVLMATGRRRLRPATLHSS